MSMTNFKLLLVVVFLCLGIATNGFSITIDTTGDGNYDTYGGNIDTWLGTATKTTISNSGQQTETDWVNAILTSLDLTADATFYVTEDPVEIYNTNVSTVFAALLVDETTGSTDSSTEYFIVKNSNYWALFANADDMDWAVIDTDLLPDDMKVANDLQVSHVTQYNGTSYPTTPSTQSTPEPASMILLGFGMMGSAFVLRRKSLKKS